LCQICSPTAGFLYACAPYLEHRNREEEIEHTSRILHHPPTNRSSKTNIRHYLNDPGKQQQSPSNTRIQTSNIFPSPPHGLLSAKCYELRRPTTTGPQRNNLGPGLTQTTRPQSRFSSPPAPLHHRNTPPLPPRGDADQGLVAPPRAQPTLTHYYSVQPLLPPPMQLPPLPQQSLGGSSESVATRGNRSVSQPPVPPNIRAQEDTANEILKLRQQLKAAQDENLKLSHELSKAKVCRLFPCCLLLRVSTQQQICLNVPFSCV